MEEEDHGIEMFDTVFSLLKQVSCYLRQREGNNAELIFAHQVRKYFAALAALVLGRLVGVFCLLLGGCIWFCSENRAQL